MTHIHIPDGILPVWIWASGLVITAAALWLCLRLLKTRDMKRDVPLLGALSAAMLVSMSVPVLPFAYHINLSVAAGILLGPALGFSAAFIVNLILAFTGHGGITVIGLNTILLGSEAVLGHMLFHIMMLKKPLFWRAAASTMIALFATTLLLIAIVAASNADLSAVIEQEGHDHAGEPKSSVSSFAALVLSFGVIGWAVEAAITGAVINFISQVKPDMLEHSLHANSGLDKRGKRDLP